MGGVGLGQPSFAILCRIFPEAPQTRRNPCFTWCKGLGAHNVPVTEAAAAAPNSDSRIAARAGSQRGDLAVGHPDSRPAHHLGRHLPGDSHPFAQRLRAVRDDSGDPGAAQHGQRLRPRQRAGAPRAGRPHGAAAVVRHADPAQSGARRDPVRHGPHCRRLLPPADRRRPAARAGPALPRDAVHRPALGAAFARDGFPQASAGQPGLCARGRGDGTGGRARRARRVDAGRGADGAVLHARGWDDLGGGVADVADLPTSAARATSRATAG